MFEEKLPQYEWQSPSSSSISRMFGFPPSASLFEDIINQNNPALFFGMPSLELKRKIDEGKVNAEILYNTDDTIFSTRYNLILSHYALGYKAFDKEDIIDQFTCLSNILNPHGKALLLLRGSLFHFPFHGYINPDDANNYIISNYIMKCFSSNSKFTYNLKDICRLNGLKIKVKRVAEYSIKSILDGKGKFNHEGSYPTLFEVTKSI